MDYRNQSGLEFHPKLSWSHYRILMWVENPEARAFYEKEVGENGVCANPYGEC